MGRFVGVSLVLHVAVLAWLALGGAADPPIEPPRVRFQLRLASIAASEAVSDPALDDELRPREIELERMRAPEDAPPPRRNMDNATLDPAGRESLIPRGDVPLRARGRSPAEIATPRRLDIEPLRSDAPSRRVDRSISLAPPTPPLAGASSPSVESGAAEGEAHPDPLHSPQPEYPRLARLRGWEGTCVLLARVGADGRLLELTVLESSGRAVLDEAALDGVRRWRFAPARSAGRAVASTARIPVTFRMLR